MTATAHTPVPQPPLIDDGPIGWRFKGMPADAAGRTLAEFGAEGRGLFDAGFSWPLLVLRESALQHNATLMARYIAEHDMSLAPHLKTTASPELAGYALRAGAWGVTVATPHQARVFMAAGHSRILFANELVDRAFAREVVGWLDGDEARDFYCYVDSCDGVAILREALDGVETARPLSALIEIGHDGGRGGCRSLDAVAAVRDTVQATDRLALAGSRATRARSVTPGTRRGWPPSPATCARSAERWKSSSPRSIPGWPSASSRRAAASTSTWWPPSWAAGPTTVRFG